MRRATVAIGVLLALVLAGSTVASSGPGDRRAKNITYVYKGHVVGDRLARVQFDLRYDPDWTRRDPGYRGFHTVLDFHASNVHFRCADGFEHRSPPQWSVGEARIPILGKGQWAAYAEEQRTREVVLERYALRGEVARPERLQGGTWKGWFRASESRSGEGISTDGCRTGRLEWRAELRDQRPPSR
jgi:hypothetical protein